MACLFTSPHITLLYPVGNNFLPPLEIFVVAVRNYSYVQRLTDLPSAGLRIASHRLEIPILLVARRREETCPVMARQ